MAVTLLDNSRSEGDFDAQISPETGYDSRSHFDGVLHQSDTAANNQLKVDVLTLPKVPGNNSHIPRVITPS